MEQILPITVEGHVLIKDDLGTVLLDKHNAVHPQNMSRIIARALSNESNYYIHGMAFGNGGTVVDAAFQITYKSPNDGQSPDPAEWRSRLYNETYREIVDDSNTNIGDGTGSVPGDDPISIEHVSGPGVRSSELGITSEVVVEVVLNPGEPTGQLSTDNQAPTENTESDFSFDEIGLYTTGAPNIDLPGIQEVNVGDRRAFDDTGLVPSTIYSFDIVVDGASQTVSITTPASGTGGTGEILFSDLVALINAAIPNATASISDNASVQTYGFLRFTSNTTGATSTINLTDGVGNGLFASIVGFVAIDPAVNGTAAGIDNDPVNSTTERERLLTHLIFSPVLKSANRTLTITYTVTVAVARNV